MPSELEYTLADFVRTEVATSEEWQEWERVRDSAPPATHTRMAPPTAVLPYLREQESPSSEYVRSVALRAHFIDGLRKELSTGRWVVRGRVDTPLSRQQLEPVDWSGATIDFDGNVIGRFKHVEIGQRRPETGREVLQRFIERICGSAKPGEPLTKELVRDVAERTFPRDFGTADFAVAWKEANIHPDWRKAGPRTRTRI